MKKIFSTMVMVAAMAIFISSAQAAIKIQVASEVQNGVALIKGNGAVPGAQITWEGSLVTRANNKNGGFSFFGVLPDDCTGVLSDGNETGSVTVLNCTACNTADSRGRACAGSENRADAGSHSWQRRRS